MNAPRAALAGAALLALALAAILDDRLLVAVFQYFRPARALEQSYFSKLAAVRLGLAAAGVAAAAFALPGSRRFASEDGARRLLVALVVAGAALGVSGAVRLALYCSDRLVMEPDVSEYVAGAVSLAREGRIGFEVNGDRLPLHYPPGTSLLLSPAAVAFGPRGVALGAVALGLAAAGLTTAAVARSAGRPAALGCALFWLASPAALKFSGQPLAEAPSLLASAAVCAVCLGAGERSVRRTAALSLLAGAAVSIRLSNAVILAPLVAADLLARPRGLGRAAVAAAAGCLPILALAAFQHATLGSPARTGYDFWIAGSGVGAGGFAGRAFGLGGVFGRPPDGETPWPNALAYGLALLGLHPNVFGAIWLPGTVAAALAGARAEIRSPAPGGSFGARVALGTTAFAFAFFVLYYYQESRFLAPLVPLWSMVAGPWIARAIAAAGPEGRRVLLALVAACVGAAGVFVHGQARWMGGLPSKGDFGADVARRTEAGAAVVSPLDAATFFAFVPPGERLYVPLEENAHSPLLERRGTVFVAARDPARLIALARERPVYLDARFPEHRPHAMSALRGALPWRPVGGESALLRLEPDARRP